MKRLTSKSSYDGYEDVRLCPGVTVGDAICQLADYEDTGLEPDGVSALFKCAESERIQQLKAERDMLAKKLAALEQESFRWRWHYDLPAEDNRDTLFLVASGRGADMVLEDAIVIGCYMGNGQYFLEDYPEIDDATVKCWTTIPEVE